MARLHGFSVLLLSLTACGGGSQPGSSDKYTEMSTAPLAQEEPSAEMDAVPIADEAGPAKPKSAAPRGREAKLDVDDVADGKPPPPPVDDHEQ